MNPAIVVSLVSPVVAVIIAVWGVRRSLRSERLKVFFEMQDKYLSERARHGRRLIYTRISADDPEATSRMTVEDRSTIGYALAVMNAIAVCSDLRYTDERLMAAAFGRSYLRAIRAARPYIDQVESERGFRPYKHAERFGERLAKMYPDG